MINPVINVTAARVDKESDGLRNLTNSAHMTLNIIAHPSFQRMSLQVMPESVQVRQE